MDVVGDLLVRDRRTRDPALVTPDGRERTHHELITNAYKAANVLRYLGARQGSTVAVAPVSDLQPTLALLGAAGLGARARLDPADGVREGDRVVLAPVADETAVDAGPGTNLAVFGGPPDRPETTHWEQELWSENPATPPAAVAPDDPYLLGESAERGEGEGSTGLALTHGETLAVAGSVADRFDLGPSSRVVVRAALADPRTVAAGLVAPLSVGGAVVLAGPGSVPPDADALGDVAITAGPLDDDERAGTVPEPDRLRVEAIDA